MDKAGVHKGLCFRGRRELLVVKVRVAVVQRDMHLGESIISDRRECSVDRLINAESAVKAATILDERLYLERIACLRKRAVTETSWCLVELLKMFDFE